jgi:hypothetical protein
MFRGRVAVARIILRAGFASQGCCGVDQQRVPDTPEECDRGIVLADWQTLQLYSRRGYAPRAKSMAAVVSALSACASSLSTLK